MFFSFFGLLSFFLAGKRDLAHWQREVNEKLRVRYWNSEKKLIEPKFEYSIAKTHDIDKLFSGMIERGHLRLSVKAKSTTDSYTHWVHIFFKGSINTST